MASAMAAWRMAASMRTISRERLSFAEPNTTVWFGVFIIFLRARYSRIERSATAPAGIGSANSGWMALRAAASSPAVTASARRSSPVVSRESRSTPNCRIHWAGSATPQV